jgi:predicted dithiol-disulfide oxidoreductase (DUF899 family)
VARCPAGPARGRKAVTRRSDELARQRQELPWNRIDKQYRFETDAGMASLANLFHGRSQLLVYRWSVTSCSGTATPQDPDLLGERGWLQRLRRPPRQSQRHAVCRLTGSAGETAGLQAADRLELPLVSSFGSDFNYELHVSHSKEEWEAGAVEYLFRKRDLRPSAGEESSWNAWSESTVGTDWETCRREGPGMSAFALKAGVAYHTYSAYERGIDILWGMYQWLDRAPFGRNDTGMWWRRHDEYDSQSCARKQVPPKGVGLMGPGGKRRMDPRSTAWDVTGRRNAKECGLQ